MEKNKKSNSKYKIIFYGLLLLFLFIYVAGKTGYYETHLQKNTVLTKEAIMNFENDIKEGNPVDIKDYINAEVPDYRNKYSNAGYKLSKTIDKILNEGLTSVGDFLKALFS